MKNLFQYEDDWSRYEIAKSRGAIHSHALYVSKDHYIVRFERSLHCRSYFGTRYIQPWEVDIAKDLEKWLQSTELNTDETYSPNFVSMHPAGGTFVANDKTEDRKWVPNKNLWPKPDGTLEESNPNILKDCLSCKTSKESLTRFQVDVVNKKCFTSVGSIVLDEKLCQQRKEMNRDEEGNRLCGIVVITLASTMKPPNALLGKKQTHLNQDWLRGDFHATRGKTITQEWYSMFYYDHCLGWDNVTPKPSFLKIF